MDASSDSSLPQSGSAAASLQLIRLPGIEWLARHPAISSATALVLAVAATFVAHLPVLGHYFFGDDFVPLAEIASSSTGAYVKDLFLLRDITPNWRFLPGLFYLGSYRAFGLDAFPMLLANVLLHLGTVALIFTLVRRIVGRVWPAFLAAAFFGLTAASAPTVAQVTAFNNVLAGFLVMLSLVTLHEGLARGRPRWWVALSAIAFAGAIASNESTAALAPVPALLALWKLLDWERWRQPQAWIRPAPLVALYGVVGGAALVGFGACRCTEAASVYAGGGQLFGNVWIYLGRLLYPIGLEFPGEVGAAHLVAGLVVAALALALLVLGPALARICVAFLALALIPYLPIDFALAPRYVYMASIPFSILAALLVVHAATYLARLAPALPLLLAPPAVVVMALYGWQTWEQNQFIADGSATWEALVSGLEESYPELPEGSRVIVRGGPHTGVLEQFFVLPAVGEVIWGGVELYSFPEETEVFCLPPDGDLYVTDFDDGRYTPVEVTDVDLVAGTPRPAIAVSCKPPAVVP